MCRRMKGDHSLILFTSINSNEFKVLDTRPETIKHTEEKVGNKLYNIGFSAVLGT